MAEFKIALKVDLIVSATTAEEALEFSWAWRKRLAEAVSRGDFADLGVRKIAIGPGPTLKQLNDPMGS